MRKKEIYYYRSAKIRRKLKRLSSKRERQKAKELIENASKESFYNSFK